MFTMHAQYLKRTKNNPARNKPSANMQNKRSATDTSNEQETNQQEINDQSAKMSCLQWKHKQFMQEMSNWHVCYAHPIHQNQPHFLA